MNFVGFFRKDLNDEAGDRGTDGDVFGLGFDNAVAGEGIGVRSLRRLNGGRDGNIDFVVLDDLVDGEGDQR